MISVEQAYKSLNTFKNLVAQHDCGKFFHANLFYSPDKYTNEMFCKIVAKLLVCKDNLACSSCEQCIKVEKDSNPDVTFFGLTSRFSTQDVEKINQEQVLRPMIADCKVYVIMNFDNATMQAQNKLLKVLEEPSNNVYFIISATNLDAVLPTIKSRCKLVKIEPFDAKQLHEISSSPVSDMLVLASGGYLGKFNDLTQGGDFAQSLKIANSVVFELKSSAQVIDVSSELASNKQEFLTRLNLIQNLYRQIMMGLLVEDGGLGQDNAEQINNIKHEFTIEAVLEILQEIDLCKKKFDANVNLNMICDGLLMKILEVKYLCKQK